MLNQILHSLIHLFRPACKCACHMQEMRTHGSKHPSCFAQDSNRRIREQLFRDRPIRAEQHSRDSPSEFSLAERASSNIILCSSCRMFSESASWAWSEDPWAIISRRRGQPPTLICIFWKIIKQQQIINILMVHGLTNHLNHFGAQS